MHNLSLWIADLESPVRASKAVNLSLVRNTGGDMRDAIKQWWEGELMLPENDPNSNLVIISVGSYRRHWTSQAVHWAVDFYLREWKWTLGAVATVVGALVYRKF